MIPKKINKDVEYMEDPLISIVVPIYKAEQYLSRCIDSILAQTYTNFELILVDDGSPDNCPQICDEYAKKDKRIKVIHKKNGGLSSARNAGLEIAQGQYVYFIDSDDYLEKHALQIMIDKIADNDVAIFGYIKEYSTKKVNYDFSRLIKLKPEEQLKELISTWAFGFVWNKLYKREIITETFNNVPREDLDFNSRIFQNVKNYIIVPGVYYHYVQQSNSITHKVQNISFKSILDCHINMINMFEKKGYYKIVPYQNTAFLKSLINIFKYDKYKDIKITDYNYLYENKFVKEALNNYKCNNLKEKIFIILIKLKRISLLKQFI